MATLASISANSIDLETITTLAGILGTTAQDVSTTNQIMENQLVYNLATDFTGENIAEHMQEVMKGENIYESQLSDLSGVQFFANQIDRSLRSTFDIVTPVSSNDGNFALSSQYVEPPTINYDSVSNPIGNNINKGIYITSPTEAIYDSHIRILSRDNNGPFYIHDSTSEDSKFTAVFDASNNNNNIIRALNSKFCTTDNSNPLYVEENVAFNVSYAANPTCNKYFTIDASGKPIANDFDISYDFSRNGFNIDFDTTLIVDNSQFGSYKIEQLSDEPDVSISADGDELLDENETPISDNLPLFNYTLGVSGNNKLPESVDIDEYYSLFSNSEDPWGSVPGYEFSMTITDSSGSGFVLRDSNNLPVLQDPNNLFSLDNSNLTDNYDYMANYVAGSISLDFSNASVTINPVDVENKKNIDNNLLTLDGAMETLSQGEHGNGEVILNIHSTETRVSEEQNDGNEQSDVLKTNVIYNDEDGVNGRPGIASDLKNNSHVRYLNELVVKNSSNDINYSRSNGAAFNLVSNGSVVNSNFNPTDIDFSYNNGNLAIDDDTLQIIKLNVRQELKTDNLNALINKANNERVDNYTVAGSITNFASLLTPGKTLDKIFMDVNLKPVQQLSMYSAGAAKGWSLVNFTTSQVNSAQTNISTVSSRFTSAYPESTSLKQPPTTWPNIYEGKTYYNDASNNTNEVVQMLTSSNYVIDYTISITPTPLFVGNRPGLYFDTNVTWGMNLVGTQQPAKPWQISLNEKVDPITNLPATFVLVDPETYTLDLSALPFGAKNAVLGYYTVTNRVKCICNVGLLPYDNLTLTSPEFTVTYNYYLIQYTTRFNQPATDFTTLNRIVTRNLPNIIDYTDMPYSVFGLAENHALSFDGRLSPDDLREISIQAFAENDDGSITQLSEPVYNTAFYNIDVKMNLNINYQADPLENTPPTTGDIVMSFTGDTVVPLASQSGYKINFIVDANGTYSVSSFSSPISQLGLNVDNFANSLDVISVSDGYSNISNWVDNLFSVQGVTDDAGNTILSIVDTNSNVVFTLTTREYNFINTQSFFTICNNDIWRIQKQIGSSSEDYSLTERFISTNYANNMFSPDVGVYVLGNNSTLLDATSVNSGYVYDFTLLKDKVAVNLVGSSAASELQAINNLSYQYVNGETSYSRTLSLAHYRGYYGTQSVDQVYTIDRDALIARFSSTVGESYVEQLFNVYNGTSVTVDNLVDSNNYPMGGIGLQISFNLSLLSSSESKHYDLYAIGDNVAISIVNPNYEAFVPINSTATLKDHNLYEFSGVNFKSTSGPLRIAPSRLKLLNSDFVRSSASYKVGLKSARTNLYFEPNYLGNPANFNGWNSDKLLFSGTYENWLLLNNGGYGYDTSNNENNSFMQISRTPNVQNVVADSYFVVCPAYFKFAQTGNFVAESTMPYSPSVNALANVVERYLPIDNSGNSVYNPFVSKTVEYISGEEITVNCDAVKTNNVTFVYNTSSKKVSEYISDPISSKCEIVVNGNYYTINAYLGQKDSPNAIYIATLFDDVSNKLLLVPQRTPSNGGSLNFISSKNTNSGAKMSYLQTLISYSNIGLTLSEVFADPNANDIDNNVCFDVDSFFLQINNNANKLNLPILQGIEVSMYTKEMEMDSSGNMFVNVYRYPPIANSITKSNQVTSIFYNSRQVKIIPVPSISVQEAIVPDWNKILRSLAYSDVSAISWENDTDFNNSGSILFASLVNLTKLSISTVEPLIFAVETSGIKKITLVNKQPLLKIVNKVGMPLLEIDANGVIKAPIVSAKTLILNQMSSASVNSSLSSYPMYSILGNVNDNIV